MNKQEPFRLKSEIIGEIPIINHYLERLQVDKFFSKYLIGNNVQHGVTPSVSLSILLRNLVIEREPLYTLSDWSSQYAPYLFNLSKEQLDLVNDDRIGRALDKLFDADRASLQTELILHAIQAFNVNLNCLHNDSTTITFTGKYNEANGEIKRGKDTVKITTGFNKDHRPDLKQLLWILTVTADGTIPIHYKICDGNKTDDTTHITTWKMLRKLVGNSNFLYVADSKLCVSDTLKYIDQQGGRFLTVLPRTRSEDKWFREYIVNHTLEWEEINLENSSAKTNSSSIKWRMVDSPLPSAEGFRIVWCWSSQKAAFDAKHRQEKIKKAITKIELLQERLKNPRSRLKSLSTITKKVDEIFEETKIKKWFRYTVEEVTEKTYQQTQRGRPGPNTKYKSHTTIRYQLNWKIIHETTAADACSDGMFPLITNMTDMPLQNLLMNYKYQPKLEKRFEQLKTVSEVMPVLLKSITRIEALLFLYFIALLVRSLIEREVRKKMAQRGITNLPLYPEKRLCYAPTTDRILSFFRPIQLHSLFQNDKIIQTFTPQYNPIQIQLLELLGVQKSEYPELKQ